MVKLGNFFFHYRNFLFPVFYLLMFIPYVPRVTDNYFAMMWTGLVVLIAGQTIRLVTIGMDYIKRGGKNRRIYAEGLVTGGLFAHSRNPMYVGNVTMIVGMGIMSNSVFYLLVMVPFFYFIYECIIRAEENYLRTHYGKAFDAYCADVPRWLPNLKGIAETFKSQKLNLKKMFYKEYNTTFVWMSGAILVALFNCYWIYGENYCEINSEYFVTLFTLSVIFYFTIRYFKKSELRRKLA